MLYSFDGAEICEGIGLFKNWHKSESALLWQSWEFISKVRISYLGYEMMVVAKLWSIRSL